jgi:hypothetical protein
MPCIRVLLWLSYFWRYAHLNFLNGHVAADGACVAFRCIGRHHDQQIMSRHPPSFYLLSSRVLKLRSVGNLVWSTSTTRLVGGGIWAVCTSNGAVRDEKNEICSAPCRLDDAGDVWHQYVEVDTSPSLCKSLLLRLIL